MKGVTEMETTDKAHGMEKNIPKTEGHRKSVSIEDAQELYEFLQGKQPETLKKRFLFKAVPGSGTGSGICGDLLSAGAPGTDTRYL